MKPGIMSIAALLLCCTLSHAQEVRDWENPQVNGIGRLASHVYALPLQNVEWYGRGPEENYIDRCSDSSASAEHPAAPELWTSTSSPSSTRPLK